MPRKTWIVVAGAIALAAAVGVLGRRVAERDRRLLLEAFEGERLSRVRFAAREVSEDLHEAWSDLEVAARLVETASTAAERARELRAVLDVFRTSRALAVWDGAGRRELAIAASLPPGPWTPGPLDAALEDAAHRAIATGGPAFTPVFPAPGSGWYRVIAVPCVRPDGGAVALAIDLAPAFRRLSTIAPEHAARVVVLGPGGSPTPLTPASLDGTPGSALARVHAALQAGGSGTLALRREEAAALGIGGSDAFAAFADAPDQESGPWMIALAENTEALHSRERGIVLALSAIGAALAVGLSVLAAWLVVSARYAARVEAKLRAAERVARERERAEGILEHLPVAVVALGADGRLATRNRAAREVLGAAAPGAALEVAFPAAAPEHLVRVREAVQAAKASGEVRTVPGPLALAGRERAFALHAVPIATPVADAHLLLVLADVTEQRSLTGQLVRAEKLATVGVLAAGIAHEIGTPLAVVRGRAERILEKLGDGHPRARDVAIILAEADRVARTIRELLDYARPSPPRTTPVDAANVAATVAALLAVEATARRVSLGVEIPPGLPPVAADADQLQQVLVNVVLNGVQACSAGGRVTVRAAGGARGMLALEVEDEGAGIPDDLRDRVFDPFFTTKKRGQGTGLGLTVAARLVHGSGGRIELDSAPGRGTRVRIAWPVAGTVPEVGHG